jgi:EpsI family protein
MGLGETGTRRPGKLNPKRTGDNASALEEGKFEMKSQWRFLVLLMVILLGGLLANAWAYLGEAHVERQQLREFPKQIGPWQQNGGDQIIDSATLSVLRASDYLLRDYYDNRGGVLNFYVGYYATQRDGASYHSPLNCLPGSGWVMTRPESVTITPADGSQAFTANRFLIESGPNRSVLLYWYQGRGRRIASEYWGKIYTVLDSVKLRRSDAAMVRVTVPVGDSEPLAMTRASDFAANAVVSLSNYVPD